jgi:hypothetical protein
MARPSFSRFVYCDTNILSHLSKHRELWSPLSQYLLQHDLTLAVGSQVAELTDAPRLHEALAIMLTAVPAAIIKQWDVILEEEVRAHPDQRNDTLLSYPLNALLLQEGGPQELQAFLSSDALRKARSGQLAFAAQLAARHNELKSNFPPSAGETYTREQASSFAWMQTIQWLAKDHRNFLEQFQSNVVGFNDKTFSSVRLFGLVLFYKYYLGRRDPRRMSDFGDLAHLFAIPYCTVAIMERDLTNVLQQIKRHDPVLRSTTISDIGFFGKWPPPEVPSAGSSM